MTRPTPELYDQIWTHGHYREGSTCLRLAPWLRTIIPAGSVVNDYGSGTGRAERLLLEHCSRVNMVDWSAVALEDEARMLIGDRLTYTIAPLEELPADFPVADWGICINVLMVVDPEKLDRIMAEMRRTCRNLVIEVYDTPDVRLGENRTLCAHDGAWWASKMREFWPVVESYPDMATGHKRRYITVGRSASPDPGGAKG